MSDFALLGSDLVGFLLAAATAVVLWFLPAALIARSLSTLAPNYEWRPLTPALAFACLPVFDAVAITAAGVGLAVVLHLVAALVGLFVARRWLPRCSSLTIAACVAWWLYLAVLYVDVDYDGGLHQSLLVVDLVKHAAVVREITLFGLPLRDPFFLRSATAGYYHYFYDGAAVIDYLGRGLIDARMAFVGLAFACGIAFASLLRAFISELDWQNCADRRLTALVVLACSIGGLDLLGVWFRWSAAGVVERNSEWWDDEISLFTTSASWVPHHLAAVIACFTAILSLARAHDSPQVRISLVLSVFAGVAFASSFGLSVWVTLGAAGALALSIPFMARRNFTRWIWILACAASIAIVISIPQILELYSGRTGGAAPIGLSIREPARIAQIAGRPFSGALYLALTPLVWGLEFGVFALGSFLFWKSGEFERKTTLWRLLICCLVAGLLLNLFVRSMIINNDFGWRVAWFAAFPAMLMTIAFVQQPQKRFGANVGLLVMAGFGFAATLYNAVAARAPPVNGRDMFAYVNADPKTDYALARAYRWAARALPVDAILQHNPAANPRAIDFGLYGTQPTGVADGEATLFGASADAVRRRVRVLGSVFDGRAPMTGASRLHLVVTRHDPLWSRLSRSDCIYLSDAVCITRILGIR